MGLFGKRKAAAQPQEAEVWSASEVLGAQRVDLLALIPLVAIVALVGLVGTLVFLVAQADATRARAKLATDALWVEQTLSF
ncbi:hypothetical protein SAMN05877809_1234, partial [Rhodobacter sp. JA431]